jgi:hypothetical protein
MPRAGECPWCRKPIAPGELRCAACGYKLRDPPRPAAERGLDARPVLGHRHRLASWISHHRPIVLRLWLPAGLCLFAVLAWYVYTRPVRGELGRVEDYLEGLPQLEHVSVQIPRFTRRLPDSVPVTAVGLPGGYPSEVHIPLQGTYQPATRKAALSGGTFVILVNTRVELKWEFDVPAGEEGG